MCVCVCVCARARVRNMTFYMCIHISTHTLIYNKNEISLFFKIKEQYLHNVSLLRSQRRKELVA